MVFKKINCDYIEVDYKKFTTQKTENKSKKI